MTRTTASYLAILVLIPAIAAPLGSLAAADNAALTPDDALQRLKDGNQRFADGKATNPNSDAARRIETAREGQYPFAMILGCSDSRVPPARIFDCGIGDLFVVRVAGNVAGADELGSLEYGAEHLHLPLLVVLGHTHCGAVAAAVENAPVGGFLKPLLAHIEPAVVQARKNHPGAAGEELELAAIKENVWRSISDTLGKSDDIRELTGAGKVKVVVALYNLETGKVEWLGPHPEQDRLLRPEKNGAAPGDASQKGAKE